MFLSNFFWQSVIASQHLISSSQAFKPIQARHTPQKLTESADVFSRRAIAGVDAGRVFALQLSNPAWGPTCSCFRCTPTQYVGLNGYSTDNSGSALLWVVVDGGLYPASLNGTVPYIGSKVIPSLPDAEENPSLRIEINGDRFSWRTNNEPIFICQYKSTGLIVGYRENEKPSDCYPTYLITIPYDKVIRGIGGSDGLCSATSGNSGSASASATTPVQTATSCPTACYTYTVTVTTGFTPSTEATLPSKLTGVTTNSPTAPSTGATTSVASNKVTSASRSSTSSLQTTIRSPDTSASPISILETIVPGASDSSGSSQATETLNSFNSAVQPSGDSTKTGNSATTDISTASTILSLSSNIAQSTPSRTSTGAQSNIGSTTSTSSASTACPTVPCAGVKLSDPAQALVDAIDDITKKYEQLQNAATPLDATLTGLTAVPQVINGFQEIVSSLISTAATFSSLQQFDVQCDEQAISAALRRFVQANKTLLELFIKKVGLISTIPTAGPPLAAILRTFQDAIGGFANGIIALLPSQAQCLQSIIKDLQDILKEVLQLLGGLPSQTDSVLSSSLATVSTFTSATNPSSSVIPTSVPLSSTATISAASDTTASTSTILPISESSSPTTISSSSSPTAPTTTPVSSASPSLSSIANLSASGTIVTSAPSVINSGATSVSSSPTAPSTRSQTGSSLTQSASTTSSSATSSPSCDGPDPRCAATTVVSSAQSVIDLINNVTAIAERLIQTANSITIVNVVATAAQIASDFAQVVTSLTQAAANIRNINPFDAGCDADAIALALVKFVQTLQALLNAIIGKAGLINSIPLAGPPVAQALRLVSGAFDTIAGLIIGIIPSRACYIREQVTALQATFANAIRAFS